MLKKLSIAAASATIATLTTVSGANAQISGTGTGFSFPDDDPSGVSSSITITDNETINDVSVLLDDLNHTWAGDLIVSLTHEDTGTSVDLFNRPIGACGFFACNTDLDGDYNFSDSATLSFISEVENNSGGGFLAGGNFSPEEAFSAFIGESTSGTWTLFVSDNEGGDTGELGAWNITFNDSDPVSTPEPASLLALLGVATLGANSLKRKHKEEV